MAKNFYKKTNKQVLKDAINLIGGVVKLGKKLNIHYTAISKWTHTSTDIPIKHAIKIEKLTNGKIKAKDLRPDVFE